MTDPSAILAKNASSPADEAFAITTHNTNDLPKTVRAIYVGTGGDIQLLARGSDAAVTFKNVPSGSILPVRARRVRTTGTTATDLIGLV